MEGHKIERIVREGVVAGLIGAASVALFFSVADVIAGHSPFQTASTLGAALFYGVKDPALVNASPAYVFAFNGVHLLAFLGFGIVAAALAALADRGMQLWYVSLFLFIFAGFHLVGTVQWLAAPMQSVIPAWSVWAAGIVAAFLMAAYLVAVHPAVRARQAW